MSTSKDSNKVPIAILIGNGSKLLTLINSSKKQKSKFKISLVVSHKKKSEGIELALRNKIPAIYFNLKDFQKRTGKSRSKYMEYLGWFISQKQYAPKLLVFAGWDLIVDENFMKFFKCKFGNGYATINLHPALLPNEGEKNLIKLPDRSFSPVIKGEQAKVLNEVISKKLTYFGPSVHFMVPVKFDTGKVIKREFIKVNSSDNRKSLHKKLMPIEDKILTESIKEVIQKYL